MKKSVYLATAAAFAAFTAPAAWANDAADEQSANESEASGDIIVTARRREERLNDVPISVTAIGAESMEQRGVQRVDDLTSAVPSFSMRGASARRSNPAYEIRGIGVQDSLLTADPGVGLYVNEVFRARSTGTSQSFFDIENVQVLYGPQGTLFGKSATAGALLISTKKPTDRLEGELEFSIGNLSRREATAILNVPLGDLGAIRFAGQHVKQDGFATNLTSGSKLGSADSWSGRVSVLLKPSDAIENLSVFGLYHADDSGSGIYLSAIAGCPFVSSLGVTSFPNVLSTVPAAGTTCSKVTRPLLQTAFAQQQARGPYKTALDPYLMDWRGVDRSQMTLYRNAPRTVDPYEKPRNYNFTNTTTFDVSDTIAIKNIFGYNRSEYQAGSDLDATQYKFLDIWYDQTVTQLSNELQLQGNTSKLNWVVGGIWFRESGFDIQNTAAGCGGSATLCTPNYTHQYLQALNRSYAAFAQGTYKITPELSVTVGGRYNIDKRRAIYTGTTQANIGTIDAAGFTPSAVSATPVCTLLSMRDENENPLISAGQPCSFTQNRTYKQPTYTLTLDYKPNEDLLFYASHRLGYRSGGLQSRISANARLTTFTPEKVRDVEIGFKGDFRIGGDATLRANLAVYKSWWSDLQRSTSIVPAGTTITTTVVFNAAKATVKGFEASLGVTPMQGLSIDGYLGHVDGVYNEWNTILAGVPTLVRDVPFNAPRWTGGVTAVVTPIDTPETGTVRLVGDFSFRTIGYADNPLPAREAAANLPASHFFNLSLAWDNILGSNFTARVWGRNLNNRLRVSSTAALLNSFGIAPTVIAEPRTFGLTLGYKFGN